MLSALFTEIKRIGIRFRAVYETIGLDIFDRHHEILWCCEWSFRFNKFVISDCPELNRYA